MSIKDFKDNIFLVDVEASNKTPASGLMTEFGIVHYATGDTFYGHLYNFTPHPDIPALPVVDLRLDGTPSTNHYFQLNSGPNHYTLTFKHLASKLKTWVNVHSDRPSLVSDNPAFDAMWINYFTDEHLGETIFGHSGRRIGDFYAGTQGDWKNHNKWKRYRKTKHTHNPVDDAQGNAEALQRIFPTVGEKLMPAKYVRYFGSEDWSALYIDGKLDKIGDHYTIDERISELLQVELRDSDAFLLGGNFRHEAANTLEAAEEYEHHQDNAKAKADMLRAQAAELLKEADSLT